MTDRITKVVLRGEVGDLLAKLKAVQSATKATAASMTENTREAKAWRQEFSALGATAGKVGLVAAAGVAIAVRSFANFDEAMSNVAATGEDARQSMDALRDAALEAGARTQYSATEAAGAIENLAKAGLTAQDILSGGLDGALDLAAAGGLQVADAAQYAAISMKQFGLEGSQIPHIADLLAAGAGKAVGDVSDLGAALSQAGQVANQTGLTIEETTAGLSAFASAGLLGSDAGTSFKAMLQRLTPQSAEAQARMDELGISAYDAQGNFVGLAEFAGNLKQSLADLTPEQRNSALATIFGSDAVRAASTLYEEGEAGIRKWTAAVDDQGFAAETAAIRMDNLKGDLEQLRGALETGLIGTGEGANGGLRETTQLLTGLVNAYNELPGPIKNGTLAALGLTAAVGGTLFVASRAISGYANMSKSLGGLGVDFENVNKKALLFKRGGALAAAGALSALSGPAHEADESLGQLTDTAAAAAAGFAVGGPWGAAIGAGISLLSGLGDSASDTADQVAGLTATLDKQTGAITSNTAEWATSAFQDSGIADLAKAAGVGLDTLTEAALGNADAMDEVKAAAEGLPGFLRDDLVGAVEGMSDSLGDAKTKQSEFSVATEKVTGDTELFAGATEQLTEAQKEAQDAAQSQAESIVSIGDAAGEAEGDLGSFREELIKQARALRDLRINAEEAGRKGVEEGLIASLREAGPEGAAILAKLASASESEIGKTNDAFRRSQAQVGKYTDALDGIPDNVSTSVSANTAKAKAAIADLRSSLNALEGKSWFADVIYRVTKPKATGGAIGLGYAAGGQVVGAGTGTSDSIPATGPGGANYKLSNGEHVMTANEVDMLGGQQAVYAMRAAIRNRQFSFANGGGIGSSQASSGPPILAMAPGAQFRLVGADLVELVDNRVGLGISRNNHDQDRAVLS